MLVSRCPGKLYLRWQHFDGPCRSVKNGERYGHLLLPFRSLSHRNPQHFAFPMRIFKPFCSQQLLLAAGFLLGSDGWRAFWHILCFPDYKAGMS
jgi:hypothetical protein